MLIDDALSLLTEVKEESPKSDNIQLKTIDRKKMALILRPPYSSSEFANGMIRVETILQIKKVLPIGGTQLISTKE
jgi:hypothetical protein